MNGSTNVHGFLLLYSKPAHKSIKFRLALVTKSPEVTDNETGGADRSCHIESQLCPTHSTLQRTTTMSAVSPFSSAHRLYVKSLYRRTLKNELDWIVRRDIWRAKALQVRAEFEANRFVPSYPPKEYTQCFLQECPRPKGPRYYFGKGRS